MGQLASDMKCRPYVALPSDTQVPKRDGKEQCKALKLRSGKMLSPAHPNAPGTHDDLTQEEQRDSCIDKENEQERELSPNPRIQVNEQPKQTQNNASKEINLVEAKATNVRVLDDFVSLMYKYTLSS